MLRTDAELINKLNIEVSKLAREAFGKGVALLHDVPERINRRYSFMFRYLIEEKAGTSHSLLVKIPHQSWMKTIDEAVSSEQIRAEVKFEYDTLKSIARVVSNSGERRLCALNPVGYLDDLNALVTEEIHLSMLKDRLARIPVMLGAKTAWEDFSDKLQLAGKWLKFIHAAFSRNEEVTLTELGIFERALEEIAILEKKQIPSLCFLRIKFEDLYSLLSHEKIPMSSAHDDYHLGNIFVTDGGNVGVLDPNWKDNRPIYGDLSKLLIDPVTRKMQVLFFGMSFRPALLAAYEREILSGYSSSGQFSEAVLWLYCAQAVLEKWNSNEEILAARKNRLPSFLRPLSVGYIRRYFLKLINSYLDRGLQAAAYKEYSG